MRNSKRTACIALVALAALPSAALAAGGISGGGGAARPVGGGGGGLNSGGAVPNSGGSPTQVNLGAALIHGIDRPALQGQASYGYTGSRRTLTLRMTNVNVGFDNQTTAVDVLLDGAFQVELPVAADGSVRYSADTSKGDSLPALHSGSTITILDPAQQTQLFPVATGVFQ